MSPFLKTLAAGRIEGVPVILIIALVAVALVGLLLRRTVYGRRLSAVGQNERAAALAGIRTGRVVASAFLASATLAAVTGMLLGAYVGGAFLEMGQPYLLQSLGAVVLGGSLIFGGSSTALGTLCGAFLLILIVTTMQIAGLPAGTQDIVQGLVVIAVLALAGELRDPPGCPGRAWPAAGPDAAAQPAWWMYRLAERSRWLDHRLLGRVGVVRGGCGGGSPRARSSVYFSLPVQISMSVWYSRSQPSIASLTASKIGLPDTAAIWVWKRMSAVMKASGSPSSALWSPRVAPRPSTSARSPSWPPRAPCRARRSGAPP